jgi:hypothetical protein
MIDENYSITCVHKYHKCILSFVFMGDLIQIDHSLVLIFFLKMVKLDHSPRFVLYIQLIQVSV